MKKFIYFLLCLFLFTACDNIVLRKDKSERVTFEEKLPQGEYTVYLYQLEYPEKQEDKIIFISRFERFLRNSEKEFGQDINFILPKDFYEDVKSILANEGIGNERAFFKPASLINEDERKIIKDETDSLKTPLDGGEIQDILNRQYYHILSLVGREDEYEGNFFYTEYDKRKITEEYINEREDLKKLLLEKKKNFLVFVEDEKELKNYKDDMVFLKKYDKSLERNIVDNKADFESPVLVIKSKDYKGYILNGKSLVFFEGDGEKEISCFRRYKFDVKVKETENFNYSNFVTDDEQVEISVLLGRKKYVPKRPLDA